MPPNETGPTALVVSPADLHDLLDALDVAANSTAHDIKCDKRGPTGALHTGDPARVERWRALSQALSAPAALRPVEETQEFAVQYRDGEDPWTDTYHNPFHTEAAAHTHRDWYDRNAGGPYGHPSRVVLRHTRLTILTD